MMNENPDSIIISSRSFLIVEAVRSLIKRSKTDMEVIHIQSLAETSVRYGICGRSTLLLVDPISLELKINEVLSYKESSADKGTVVLIVPQTWISHLSSLIDSGIYGFITYQSKIEEIMECIHSHKKAKNYISSDLAKKYTFSQMGKDQPLQSLSLREVEILTKIANSYPIKEIAASLHISPKTVYSHKRNIMGKLNLKKNKDIFDFALKNNLI
ncbi:LuxR C-terminal-related transcriptional regulator [Alloalcanivorax xenomutans]|jgi:two-component system, NarL family, invasion response regulator UvrY|uniref:response regulator transcription factor n=1 Tax=Alloalcanivorax xenomutans TaxID=1094342 RepID=UPI000E26BF9C